MSQKNNHLIPILVLLLIGGCKQMPEMSMPTLGLGPHKIDIQQGNVITQDMIDKLQPGMTRNQVRFVLGTPLLVDPFRTDRWDYVYSLKKRGELLEQRQLKVFFKDDKMVRYEGDVVSDTRPGAESAAGAKLASKPVAAAAKPEPVATPPSKPVAPVAQTTPAREPIPEIGKPQLQLVPAAGEAAKPIATDVTKPAAPAEAPTPAMAAKIESDGMVAPPLDAPPMPRLTMKPEESEPASPFAPAPEPDAKPAVMAKPASKLETKPTEKAPAQPGFFGRLLGGSPSQPAQSAASPAAPAPALAPVEKPVTVQPAPKSVAAPVVAKPAIKPETKPAEQPAATAAERGFFERLLDAAAKPVPPRSFAGGERIAEPGSPPPPFVDPAPAPK